MAKESLAVRFRPRTFDDMTEQSAIKDILENQIKTKTFQHGYLFTGPAGTGKTTSARIFASMINAGKGSPIEIDAASNSGVENIRSVIEDAKRKPLDADYKIFIVDECHSLSNGAWQALLKTLEEPPKFTIFIFCTTDPQKIQNTILSRVQRYNFQKISNEGIYDRLTAIVKTLNTERIEEKGGSMDAMNDPEWAAQERISIITVEEDALLYIIKRAAGGMRDAITLLDKCLSLSDELTVENVLNTLGQEDYDTLIKLLNALCDKDSDTAVKVIDSVYDAGKDVKMFLKDFAKFILEIEKSKIYNLATSKVFPSMIYDTSKLIELDIFPVMKLIVDINADVKWDTDPKTFVELAFLVYCGSAGDDD